MRTLARSLFFCVCGASLYAQTQPVPQAPAPPAQAAQPQASPAQPPQPKPPQGMAPVWDIRTMLAAVADHAERLLPVLNQIDAKEWIARGASETYAEQLESCRVQCKAVAEVAREIAKQPERLSASLDLYFRIHALDLMLASLQEGIRKYQNPAIADMVAAVAAENSGQRQGFERFLIELASQREQQILVMDSEAQRCRGNLSRQTPVIPQSTPRATTGTRTGSAGGSKTGTTSGTRAVNGSRTVRKK